MSSQFHDLLDDAKKSILWRTIHGGILGTVGFSVAYLSLLNYCSFGKIQYDYLITGAISAFLTFLLVIPLLIQKCRVIQTQKKQLELNETQLLILNSMGEGLYGVDNNLNTTFVNASFLRMLGYTDEKGLIGKNIHPIIHHTAPDGSKIHKEDCRIFQAFQKGKNGHYDNEVFWRADGTCFPVEYWSYPQLKNGKFAGGVVTFMDITERRKLETELVTNEQKYRTIFELATDAVFIMDGETFIDCNAATLKMFRCTREQIIGKPPYEFSPPIQLNGKSSKEAAIEKITAAISGQSPYFEWLHQRIDGEIFNAEVGLASLKIQDNNYLVAFVRDITQRKKAEELIWLQANFDQLTELPNRRMFHDRLDQEIKKAHRNSLPLALMFIDLDRFKEVNDTLGHDMGDILLNEAAKRIVSCVREADTVARLGGDEFTLILGQLEDSGNVERIARDILRKLAEPFQLLGEVAYISASIGITFYPKDAVSSDALLKNADQAMYLAKNSGRNRFNYFTPSMQEAAQVRMQLSNDLRGALAENQFLLYYQPIVDMVTGNIYKAEALIRWQHPTRGLISPNEFIPIAEETGLIVDIGNWVFHEAAKQVAQWRSKFHETFQISINKSPVQFYYDGEHHDHSTWFKYLQNLGLPGKSIVVEITEGVLMDGSNVINDQLRELRGNGIEVSLDDFGTGYSSLSYLKKFDINYLKIDQSFTRNLKPGSDDMALSEAIIVMAHKLRMKVIAEGVETIEQRDLLATAGCDYEQGYLFSRPVPAEGFEKLLENILVNYTALHG